ncbi:MAG: sodium-translocating pyrophosphatase [[Bacteroides] pectinophilus]|jgi:K(+)-stimulated pyrophosphate-energized sodium pump|uniref:Putative K(+)-stimulated pyrophosphate-energized sodium pump n=1 Tax=Bacteroides pectinophilus CAG:437 TaxID=1263051 RepID=R7ALP9_9FIRM|nr:sodium-translocating pyrophosphatase [[Bacteroides] pectinophilus]CDD56444.1 putative K(+)-stimulated pyrophosphate-energized sodium pump [Bacteroides pectinophilus CAG:437]
MEVLLVLVIVAALLALGYAAFNFASVKKMDEGNARMSEIAEAIRVGANAFITYEYKIIAVVVAIIAVAFAVIFSLQSSTFMWQPSVCFVIGTVMSACAGWVGMKIATYANVRVANAANKTRNIGETLKVALKGGSVMGLCVGGFALLGLFIVYIVFGMLLGLLDITALTTGGHIFTQCLSCYALGCSIVAMFNRVGGGIYTKAADMGADLVGKTEAHIPEDDPRNPATIADNVGDNVGDVAGLGSDLLESYVGAITSSIILAVSLFLSNIASSGAASEDMLQKMMYYPLVFAAIGLVACILGIAYVLLKKATDNPHKDLNISTWAAAAITVIGGLVVTYLMFGKAGAADMAFAKFNAGWLSPWIAATLGVVSGVIIGAIAEYYTSYDYKPTQIIAQASKEGPALTITQGLAVGMKSCMYPLIVLGITTYASYAVSGMFGIAMAAVGMLSFVSATVSVDTYGPISDNAGGIAEMSELDSDVRNITDKLDSVGNTTAAIGKGFAIGSASLAALSLMVSFLYAFQPEGSTLDLNFTDPKILAGALVGAALPYLFSGMLIEAVANAARKMVEEVRRQFKEIPGILEGKAKPDYKTCIEISSQGALKEMRVPAILSILFPLVCGFLFGPYFVGGLLIGATLSAIMLAIFTGNAGGAWDNGKKYIESGAIEGQGKGSPAHDAAVVGDTVGDPLKDTVGPSLDILIKIMSTVSLVAAVLFRDYNLLDWIMKMM